MYSWLDKKNKMTMDCMVSHPIWTGAYQHGGLAYHHLHHFSPYYFPRKRNLPCSFYSGSCGLSNSLDDEVGFPADIKLEPTNDCMPEDDKDFKVCVVCGEKASGFYFGALVCLPCKSFYIRCTKDGEPSFTCQCNGNCDIAKQGRIRCQYCRYQRCIMAGMCRKEKPETVQPAEGQVLCKVCGDIANGIHFGVNTCEGCKKFFRRGLVENQGYTCKGEKSCQINPRNRNNCRHCRYQKCLTAGMSREAIKMGRPKKSDGDSPQHSPSHSPAFSNPHSPELSPRCSPRSVHGSPQMSPVNESMFGKYMMPSHHQIKRKTPCTPPSCQVQSDMATGSQMISSNPFRNLKSEDFNCFTTTAPSSWPVSQSGIMSTPCDPIPCVTTTSNHTESSGNVIADEEDMDDILNFIQMDQASRRTENYRDTSSCLFQTSSQDCSMMTNPLSVNTCQNYQNPEQSSSYQQYHQQNQGSFYPNSQSPQFFQQQPSSHADCNYQASSPQGYQASSPQGYQASSPQNYQASSPQGYPSPPPPSGCHSPQSYNGFGSPPDYPQMNSYSVPQNTMGQPQMGNYSNDQSKIYMDINSLNATNEIFIKCIGQIQDLPTNENPGTITRDQLSSQVILHSLNTATYRNSNCYYSSDENNSHDSSDYMPKFAQKRKNSYTQSCSYNSNPYAAVNANDFICEKYSLQSTQNYWKRPFPFDQSVRMTEEDRVIIKQLTSAYSVMRVFYDECQSHMQWNMNKEEQWPKMVEDQSNHWNHVQERIVRNIKAFVDFCLNIPGFDQLDSVDRNDLLQSSVFQAALIICSTEWYSQSEKKFRFFWNWTVNPDNPMYIFKLHLLQAGENISKLNLTKVELAFVLALSCISADLLNLKDPERIEIIREHLIFLLQHHLAEQGVNPDKRLAEIFSIMPMTRHISFWYKQLMKNMRVNIELGAVSKLVEEFSI